MSKIVNIVLDAIESRARIVNKNGKSYIQLLFHAINNKQ